MAISAYVKSTAHPWPCFCFLLPLLAAYECGVLWLGGRHPESLRNGADTWVRWGLKGIGLHHLYWAPVLIGVIFLCWSLWRRKDRPQGMLSLCTGMTIESVVFALSLWWLGYSFLPLLQRLGVRMSVDTPTHQIVGQVITFVGAGIYEEILFRLLLFNALVWSFRWLWLPLFLAIPLAALASGTLFSYAHHVGPNGEPFNNYVFLFRCLAGVFFALLYRFRGFGITVGAHTIYDIIVGVAVDGA